MCAQGDKGEGGLALPVGWDDTCSGGSAGATEEGPYPGSPAIAPPSRLISPAASNSVLPGNGLLTYRYPSRPFLSEVCATSLTCLRTMGVVTAPLSLAKEPRRRETRVKPSPRRQPPKLAGPTVPKPEHSRRQRAASSRDTLASRHGWTQGPGRAPGRGLRESQWDSLCSPGPALRGPAALTSPPKAGG